MARTDGDRESALIVASASPCVVTCLRSLSERGVHTIAASWENETVPGFASRYCDEALVLPAPFEGLVEYKDALLTVVGRPDVRTMIPTSEVDTYVLSKYADEFADHITSIVPPLESLRTVQDRMRLFDAAEEAGVPVPKTQLLDEIEDSNREVIVKSRYNLLVDEYLPSHPPNVCKQVKSVKYFGRDDPIDFDAICEEMDHVPIVQEFVPMSNEYLFGALYDRGEPVATFQHRQVRGETYAGGGGSYRESVNIPRLEEVGRTLLNYLDWHGLACVEYMEDERTGEIKLTEINPRMWRSLPFAMRAGADFPAYYWLLATGRGDQIDPSYETDLGGHLLFGELTYLASVLFGENPNVEKPLLRTTLRDIVTSCYEHPNFDYLRLDDPGPFVRGALNTLPIVGDLSLGERRQLGVTADTPANDAERESVESSRDAGR